MATPQDQRPVPDEKTANVGVAITTSDDDAPAQVATSEADDDLKPIPWTYKWIALACVIAFPIGSNWTNASLGPLKNTLRNELGITNAQFGVISSADSFVNSIFPIIGGMTLDWWGPNRITICCTTIIFVGASVAAAAIHLETWRMLAAGHVLMGFGVAILDQAQQKVSPFRRIIQSLLAGTTANPDYSSLYTIGSVLEDSPLRSDSKMRYRARWVW